MKDQHPCNAHSQGKLTDEQVFILEEKEVVVGVERVGWPGITTHVGSPKSRTLSLSLSNG